MEYAKYDTLFPKRYREDVGNLDQLQQQAFVYIVSATGRAPYKLGYVKYALKSRLAGYRTILRKYYVHMVIGFSDAKYEEFGDRARAGEWFLHQELGDHRLTFPQYAESSNTHTDQPDRIEGGVYSELFAKGVTTTRIYKAVEQMLDPKYPYDTYPKYFHNPDQRLHPIFGYKILADKILPFRGIQTYAEKQSIPRPRKLSKLRSSDLLKGTDKGDVELRKMDRGRSFSVSKATEPKTRATPREKRVDPLMGVRVKTSGMDAYGTVKSKHRRLYRVVWDKQWKWKDSLLRPFEVRLLEV